MSKLYTMYESGAEGFTVISEEAFYTAQTYARTEKECFRYHDYHFEIIDASREDEIECEEYDFMPEAPAEDFGDSGDVTKTRDWIFRYYVGNKPSSIVLKNFTETEIGNYTKDIADSLPYVQEIATGRILYIYPNGGFRVVHEKTYDIMFLGSVKMSEVRAVSIMDARFKIQCIYGKASEKMYVRRKRA